VRELVDSVLAARQLAGQSSGAEMRLA
jgi:hypothetical protein